MFSFLQMPFLQALGYAIANSIWQVFALWLMVLLANNIAKQSSHIKYVTALSAQAAGFVWFLTTFQFYYRHCLAASVQAELLANGNTTMYLQNITTGNSNLLSFLARTEETLPYLSLAYLLFLFYLVIKWIQSFRFTKALSVNGLESIDKHWQAFVNEMADRLNIMQDVKVYLSSVAKSPLTVGYIKPLILLPVASINYLTQQQLEAVILHELAHIKRADYIINLLVSVAEMILFFNPFAHLLSNIIQKERENCCDDWVLQYQYNAGMYAEALLRIATLQKEGFEMNAAAQQKGELLQRVKRIIQPSEKKFSYRHQALAMMVIAVLLFCIAWLQPGENDYHKATAKSNWSESKKIVIAPVIAQVDNPFFNGASLFGSSLHDNVMQSVNELNKKLADSEAVGIKQAQVALAKAAPTLLATLSPGNWQRVVTEAIENEDAGTQHLNIQLSVTNFSKRLFDSAFLLRTINAALSKTDGFKDAQTGIEAAGKELENLQLNKAINYGFSFSADYLNQLGANALASLQNLHFDAMQDSLAAFEKISKITWEQNKKAQERAAKQALLLQQIQERQDKIMATADRRNRMLPLMPPQEPAFEGNIIASSNATGNDDVNEDDVQPPTYSWSINEPVVQYDDNASQVKTAKTIHITRDSDKGTINIVIEIRR